MIYELATCTSLPGKQAVLVELMEKLIILRARHGMKVVGLWITPIRRIEHVIMLLEYESRADVEKKSAAWNHDLDSINIVKNTPGFFY